MEEKSGFPVYKTFAKAKCFSCKGPLEHTRDDKMPIGEGRYVAQCVHCGLYTWFDLKREVEGKGGNQMETPQN